MKLFAKIILPCLLLASQLAVAAELPMLVNFGAGGGWYDPETSGQGMVFDIVPSSNQLVAYWFTYPEEGEAREWFVAQGDISGNRADLVIYQTANGQFGQASDIVLNEVGRATLEYASCQEASWDYAFVTSGLSGEIDLVRLGPVEFCEQFLTSASLDAVSHNNSWANIGGNWVFEGCVQLDDQASHGQERVELTEISMSLEIDSYATSDCQGAVTVQRLDFHLQRVDKTTALLDGEEVIANRYLLTDFDSGLEVRQLWYVDDRGEAVKITHGVLNSPLDDEGYPTEVHRLFFVPRD
jgi:hypothetical protein